MRNARLVAVLVAAGVLFVVTGCTGGTPNPVASASASAAASAAPEAVTPVTISAVGDPLVVAGSDGMTHIDYDLLVTNAFTAPVTLTSVAVRDAQSGATVFEVTGDALAAVTEGNFSQRQVTPAAQIAVSGQVSVEVDVKLPSGAAVPTQLDHVVGWSLPADAPALSVVDGKTTGEVTALPLAVSSIQAVTIASPLTGSGWWSLQGCCQPNGHRSLRYAVDGTHEIKAEMFAVDWVQLRDGAFFTGDGSSNDDYPYIGSDLLAVADGTVVRTRDDLPNETPQAPPLNVKTGEDYTGNTVVIQIAPDRYAIYGHIDPGTVSVKVGDTVKTGDVVGKLGSSGNSTAAHLHFVITDKPDFLLSTSIPFVIDSYTLEGTAVIPDGPGEIPTVGPSSKQTATHPLWESVADFG